MVLHEPKLNILHTHLPAFQNRKYSMHSESDLYVFRVPYLPLSPYGQHLKASIKN